MNDPDFVVLAGDWHGNTGWACHVVEEAAKLLPDERQKIIVHAGDFGVWPGAAGRRYLDEVAKALWIHGVYLWFVDGNHEWHPELIALRKEEQGKGNQGLVPIDSCSTSRARIFWIPRGHRWEWNHQVWMGLGGAVSVDAAVRTEGKTWWREEAFTAEDLDRARSLGHADVMVTHDVPDAVKLTFDPPPRFWDVMDIARSDAHRAQLQDVVDVVQPEVLVHGHAHQVVRTTIAPYGTQVIGLHMDGENGNYTLFDTRTLKEVPVP